jgi:hypothetical protein
MARSRSLEAKSNPEKTWRERLLTSGMPCYDPLVFSDRNAHLPRSAPKRPPVPEGLPQVPDNLA